MLKINLQWYGCGATLVSCDPVIIVSAAHCFYGLVPKHDKFAANDDDYDEAVNDDDDIEDLLAKIKLGILLFQTLLFFNFYLASRVW